MKNYLYGIVASSLFLSLNGDQYLKLSLNPKTDPAITTVWLQIEYEGQHGRERLTQSPIEIIKDSTHKAVRRLPVPEETPQPLYITNLRTNLGDQGPTLELRQLKQGFSLSLNPMNNLPTVTTSYSICLGNNCPNAQNGIAVKKLSQG